MNDAFSAERRGAIGASFARALQFALLVVSVLFVAQTARAQDFEIDRYEVSATLRPSANAAEVSATLKMTNRTTQGASARNLSLFVAKEAKVSGVTVNGTAVKFEQTEYPRLNGMTTVTGTLPSVVAPDGKIDVAVQYVFTVKESTPYAAITPGDTLVLPESFWMPVVHTPLTPHGADTAPFVLTVTNSEGGDVLADGSGKTNGSTVVFESALAGQPWLMVAPLDKPAVRTVAPTKTASVVVSVHTQPGLAGGGAQAQRILDEIEKILAFYAQTLGDYPGRQLTIASTPRGSTYVSPTLLLLGEAVFRRETLDAETVEFLVRGTARAYFGGKLRLRGKGLGVVQDAVPSWLTGLYFESRFGPEAAKQFWMRRVRGYAPLGAARSDAMLGALTPLDSDYHTVVLNKGALVLRLLERQIGRPALLDVVGKSARIAGEEIKLTDLRTLLEGGNANPAVRQFLKTWVDDVADYDFIIGVPQKNETGGWTCAVRNFGNTEAEVPVVAVTDKGETLTAVARIAGQGPSRGFGQVEFKTDATLASVEIDPEKLYPQTKFELERSSSQYDNDARPPRPFPFSLFLDASRLFEQKDFAGAETKLRDALAREPNYSSARMLLARVLSALGKPDAAQAELDKALGFSPPPLHVVGWSAVVQGELAAQRKDFKAALAAHRRAYATDAEIAANLAARKGVFEAETALQQIGQPDDSIKAFIGQFDKAVQTGTSAALEGVVLKADLPKFVKGIVASKPGAWTTRIVRVEPIDAQQTAVDVNLDVVAADKQVQKGSAVFVLRRIGSNWMLSRIDLFTIQ